MNPDNQPVAVFVLAKNEAKNISRCLDALASCGWNTTVLDSGSTDGTQEIARQYQNVSVVTYAYVDHATAYNDITTRLAKQQRAALILDADMVVSRALYREVDAMLATAGNEWEALQAPIEMCIDGVRLRHGSLYPPKPFAFVTGKALFNRSGHGERLTDGVRVRELENTLRHDDRKDYSTFLLSQARYAAKLIERYVDAQVTTRDKLRVRTPLLAFAVPFVSFVVKRGVFAGRPGMLYALDRMIAELVMYRHGLAMRLSNRDRYRQSADPPRNG